MIVLLNENKRQGKHDLTTTRVYLLCGWIIPVLFLFFSSEMRLNADMFLESEFQQRGPAP